MKELRLEADLGNLTKLLSFVTAELEKKDCSPKAGMQIEMALEEVFVNIAQYAYDAGGGDVLVRVSFPGDEASVEITFIDSGQPFNPLEKPDPDITLSAEERQIGGLGIWLVKENMDLVQYRNENGKNILTIRRKLRD